MGNVNTIPVVSQAKSVVQLATGDAKGAAATQEKFFHECPVVSQATSLAYLATGDAKKAGETQKRCGKTLLDSVDGIPVAGHVKGAIHYAVGDHEGGERAILAATRTTGVMAGGAAGFLVGGPVGAVTGGIATGGLFDGATTVGATNENGKYTPQGYFAGVKEIIDRPSGGAVFDVLVTPVFDGLAGYQGGQVVKVAQNVAAAKAAAEAAKAPTNPKLAAKAAKVRARAYKAMAIAEEIKETPGASSGQYVEQCNVAKNLYKKANAIENAGRPQAPVFDPKATNTKVYLPGQQGHKSKEKLEPSSQCSQETSTSSPSYSSKLSSSATYDKPIATCLTVEEIKFYQELQRVVKEFELFDSTFDLIVLKEIIERNLRGQGEVVYQVRKQFNKVMLRENEEQDFKTNYIVSVTYGMETAEKYDDDNPLKGYQVLIRHQSETMGALHILLSHPQDMVDILPGLDISLFPPRHRAFLTTDSIKLAQGAQRSKMSEKEKLDLVQAAIDHYRENPKDKERMMANELLLVAYLCRHMNPDNFSTHQFYAVSEKKHQFRVIFNMPTTSGVKRQLAICLSCEQKGSHKAIVYKSPGKDGVERDSYEIITAFLL